MGGSGRGWMNSIHDYRISTCSNRCVGRVMCCGWMGRDDDALTRANGYNRLVRIGWISDQFDRFFGGIKFKSILHSIDNDKNK